MPIGKMLTKDLSLCLLCPSVCFLAYSTLVRYFHEHDYQRKVPRPMPEPPSRKAWEDQRARFADELLDRETMIVATSPSVTKPGSKATRAASEVGQARRTNHSGAIRQACPENRPASGPSQERQACQPDHSPLRWRCLPRILDTMAEEAQPTPGRRRVLVLDNAS